MRDRKVIDVLVVDDEAQFLEQIRLMLEDHKTEGHVYDLTLVTSASQAVSLLRQKNFDLVVTDFRIKHNSEDSMNCDGLKVIREARRTFGQSVRIALMSSDIGLDDFTECFQAGTDVFISKPFRIEIFLDNVDKQISYILAEERIADRMAVR